MDSHCDFSVVLEKGARLVFEDKWMYWDEHDEVWVVLQKPYGKKKTIVLIKTEFESEASKILLEG